MRAGLGLRDTEVLTKGLLVSAGDQNSFNRRVLSQQIDLI